MLLFGGSIILVFNISCKNDIEKINALALGEGQPTVSYNDVSFEYTDTAKLQAKLITKSVDYYLNNEEPYYEFPTGIKVLFYNSDEKVKTIITSKYAIYRVEPELFEVRDSVVSRNLQDNQVVETEQMFWDQAKKIIYSNVFTKITGEDGVHFGERGFEAAQDLSYYRLIGSSGNVKVKDEETQ
ncbi:MAG: LPS export ABC transporter periplasmic protein LptC [Bacteroidales bacterium]|nr:LPS export ABC transporter periplasmic protein LptC [Bacteroidales bacterium]MBN2821481.1 LPS export ABC transporter periplasmic protein LptC [Bacteroidales bacterium]